MGDRLRLVTLGEFRFERAGEACRAFESDKARLLLAYLATEPKHPHRREFLTGLLWPESSKTTLATA
jgi:DNA-binding SARP family transcriptional activator